MGEVRTDESTLRDEDITTVMPGSGTPRAETPRPGDGTDGDATDGTDGDSRDTDGTDTQDADGTDTKDADGTDQ